MGQAAILELERAQQEALSLRFYEDKDILMAAEEECSGELYDRVQWTEADIEDELSKL